MSSSSSSSSSSFFQDGNMLYPPVGWAGWLSILAALLATGIWHTSIRRLTIHSLQFDRYAYTYTFNLFTCIQGSWKRWVMKKIYIRRKKGAKLCVMKMRASWQHTEKKKEKLYGACHPRLEETWYDVVYYVGLPRRLSHPTKYIYSPFSLIYNGATSHCCCFPSQSDPYSEESIRLFVQ